MKIQGFACWITIFNSKKKRRVKYEKVLSRSKTIQIVCIGRNKGRAGLGLKLYFEIFI
jgi:hypothetical protein